MEYKIITTNYIYKGLQVYVNQVFYVSVTDIDWHADINNDTELEKIYIK